MNPQNKDHAEHSIGRMHIDRLSPYTSDVELDLMRCEKIAPDPDRIMKPLKLIRLP